MKQDVIVIGPNQCELLKNLHLSGLKLIDSLDAMALVEADRLDELLVLKQTTLLKDLQKLEMESMNDLVKKSKKNRKWERLINGKRNSKTKSR